MFAGQTTAASCRRFGHRYRKLLHTARRWSAAMGFREFLHKPWGPTSRVRWLTNLVFPALGLLLAKTMLFSLIGWVTRKTARLRRNWRARPALHSRTAIGAPRRT